MRGLGEAPRLGLVLVVAASLLAGFGRWALKVRDLREQLDRLNPSLQALELQAAELARDEEELQRSLTLFQSLALEFAPSPEALLSLLERSALGQSLEVLSLRELEPQGRHWIAEISLRGHFAAVQAFLVHLSRGPGVVGLMEIDLQVLSRKPPLVEARCLVQSPAGVVGS